MKCKGCARDEMYCSICVDREFYADKDQVDYENWMCDMMCQPEEENLDG